MAAQGDTEKELNVHRQGYERFIGLIKVGAIICLIAAFIVILVIRK